MAATQSIPMDEFLSKQPQALRDWIEQDIGWKVEEIHSILVDAEAMYVTIDRKLDKGYESQEQLFVQSGNGEWRKKD